ncbi:hypothetical protein [Acidovorax sp. SRB_24]|uniref:hypothetical protein n=1 Tax=Acidovorax sp. SRB_24 TaxID=1962700 RepID=UPI00145DBF49|nr:hypothetical protein [Acidovorax sp. SRB_24]
MRFHPVTLACGGTRMPLLLATARNRVAIGQALIAAGADVNLPDHGGVAPLRHAEQRGHSALAALLRAAGAR